MEAKKSSVTKRSKTPRAKATKKMSVPANRKAPGRVTPGNLPVSPSDPHGVPTLITPVNPSDPIRYE